MKDDQNDKDILTVKDLYEYLGNLICRGDELGIDGANFKITCNDNPLHKGELGIDYSNKKVQLRGNLFNVKTLEDLCILERDIKRCMEKFFHTHNR